MSVTINGDTGVSKVQDGVIVQADLASGVAGNGPAFSASMVGTFSISAATVTKATLNTEQFDTASCFDNTTNYRFTPNVAGYYQLNATYGQVLSGTSYAAIYKNGSLLFQGGASGNPTVSGLVYMNGTTDYVELYLYSTNAVTSAAATIYNTFNGFLARAA